MYQELLQTNWEEQLDHSQTLKERYEEGELLAAENGLLYELMEQYYWNEMGKKHEGHLYSLL